MAHISDDTLEQLVMGTFPALAMETLEAHLLICSRCRDRLVEIEEYVEAFGAAAESLREKPTTAKTRPYRFVHDTEDGLIISEVTPRGHKWYARHSGAELDGGKTTETFNEAMIYLIESFEQMFPEHTTCTKRCDTDEVEKWKGKK